MLCLNYLYFSLMRAVNDATQFYKPYFDFLATKDSNRLRIFDHFFFVFLFLLIIIIIFSLFHLIFLVINLLSLT